MGSTTQTPGRQCADRHLPASAENPLTTYKALNRLRTQAGRSIINMLKWGCSHEPEYSLFKIQNRLLFTTIIRLYRIHFSANM